LKHSKLGGLFHQYPLAEALPYTNITSIYSKLKYQQDEKQKPETFAVESVITGV
jgi:hypothetical protein